MPPTHNVFAELIIKIQNMEKCEKIETRTTTETGAHLCIFRILHMNVKLNIWNTLCEECRLDVTKDAPKKTEVWRKRKYRKSLTVSDLKA